MKFIVQQSFVILLIMTKCIKGLDNAASCPKLSKKLNLLGLLLKTISQKDVLVIPENFQNMSCSQ